MYGIQVGSTFLALAPGSIAQLKRNNPFLTKDKIDGEYSLPVSIPYTEPNCLALGLLYSYYTPRKKTTLDAALYSGTALAYRGKLVLEGLEGASINNPRSGTLTGYFICGVSTFLYQVKDVLLKSLSLGTRSYPWTTGNPADGSAGFWQHVHATLTNSSYGYVFYPVRNDGWAGDGGTVDFINKPIRTSTGVQLAQKDNYTSLCPHLYLVPLLQRLFALYGYTLNMAGPVLQDADFRLLTLVSYRSIAWKAPNADAPRSQISWALADHVPPTWTVTDLLINLQQYFAHAFIIDPLTRTVELQALKDIKTTGTRKDWTPYADPRFASDFSADQSLFALMPKVDEADSLPGSAFDPTGKTLLPPVDDHFALRAMQTQQGQIEDKYCYCWADNTWYQGYSYNITFNGGYITYYDWAPAGYGIHGYEPANNTDTIETRVSTLAMMYTIEVVNGVDHYRLLPGCTQEGNWEGKIGQEKPWELRLLFYRGYTDEYYATAFPGVARSSAYPYATHTTQGMRLLNSPIGAWALPMVYQRPGAATGLGVKDYWWQPWLDCLQNSPEVLPFTLWLPRPVLEAHRWTDVILIRHVPYLVQSFDETLPYPGYVQAQLRRIG